MFGKLFETKESRFQKQVLETLKKEYPDQSFEPQKSPLLLTFRDTTIRLDRLYAQCQKNASDANSEIVKYFSHAIWLTPTVKPGTLEWGKISPALRPQFIPAEYLSEFPVMTAPLGASIHTGIVVKLERGVQYLRQEDLDAWKMGFEEVYAQSLKNLDGDQVETEVTITQGTDRFIGMEARDGFDAVRLLLPRVRQFAAGKLNEPFLAGIPNRDFLILWSKECSERFEEYALEKIQTDFDIQPYPLTTTLFEATAASIRVAAR